MNHKLKLALTVIGLLCLAFTGNALASDYFIYSSLFLYRG